MAQLDIYQAVTDRILELLNRGTIPWKHPISTSGTSGGGGYPTNLISQKAYRGINVFLLACTALCQGYGSPYWLTYNQAKQRGGQVRKGEKSSLVVFWKRYVAEDKKTGEAKSVPVIRHYNVFNTEQCDGVEVATPDAAGAVGKEDGVAFNPIDAAERIVSGYAAGPLIHQSGSVACYNAVHDIVRVPHVSRFENPQRYYATLFHELVHSTGHSSRLDRGLDTKLAPFGSADYSKEELVAEMGAAFLAAEAGISPQTIEHSAAYIDGWKRKLKADKKLVILASGGGQRAADHILGRQWDETTGTVHMAPPESALDGSEVFERTKAALQSFPRPGQANLNSTATSAQRSAYIAAVLGWWNRNVGQWEEDGILDPSLNPVVYRPSATDTAQLALHQQHQLPGAG